MNNNIKSDANVIRINSTVIEPELYLFFTQRLSCNKHNINARKKKCQAHTLMKVLRTTPLQDRAAVPARSLLPPTIRVADPAGATKV